MSDTTSGAPACLEAQTWAALEQENRLLRQENEKLHAIEGQLRESLSMLEATLNATTEGILVVDRAGKVKGFNRQFQRLC